ncbi:PREDICTED: probable ATP-dependent RNA helicase DDX46 [Tarenaya hassleriana]|uniref:probable ATP-dependent RNA helicase DDX46 n=1 Tax=Tarenaya hassleriana TaxID=28532 RepID=UPI00053C5511|nr:PREDICTED: probable ATP-dependent RNA helicase DDX46 [Tarenaya hassleriana]
MEEEKAAAYYDELTRKGEGAARFKQGLGFSSDAAGAPARGSAIASSSSFLSQFVRASGPTAAAKPEKDSEIRSIRDKLKKKPEDQRQSRVPERSERRRSRSRERDDRDRRHRRRSRSRSRSRERRRERERDDGERRRRRRRSRSSSPRRERRRSDDDERRGKRREEGKEERDDKVDYSKLINGYDEMSAAEKVKAKMKLQLVETAEKDTSMGSGWERFEFDKDAPVDDEEVEAADDDAALVKRMGQSFRFSAIEARREEEVKAAHEEAMFGAPSHPISPSAEEEEDVAEEKTSHEGPSLAATSLLSDKVLAKQQGSWRDRARRS